MLSDILEVFNKYSIDNKNGLLENYNMKKGIYILVKNNNLEIYDIEYDRKRNLYYNNYQESDLIKLKALDMECNILSTQKPVDKKKKIHSNNIYSFYIKRNTLFDKKKLNESIDNYYLTLKNSAATDKSLKDEFLKFNENFGEVNITDLSINRKWIEDNIYLIDEKINKHIIKNFIDKKLFNDDLKELSSINKKIYKLYKEISSIDTDNSDLIINQIINNLKLDDFYIKIFFEPDVDKVRIENQRYLLNKITLSNNYNICLNSDVYGVNSFNTTYNASKKPYAINRTRPNAVLDLKPLCTLNKINQLALLLDGYGVIGATHIFIGDFASKKNDIRGYKINELDEKFNGVYINILKSKSLDILEYENITFNPEIYLEIIDIFNEDEECDNLIFTTKRDLLNYLNIDLFSKFLIHHLFDYDIITDSYLNNIVIANREFIKNTFIYGRDINKIELFNNLDEYIKYSILYNKFFNLRKALSLKYSIMGKEHIKLLEELKINIVNTLNGNSIKFSSDEMQFLAGQLLNYYSRDINNKNNKNKILKLKSNEALISLLNKNLGYLKNTSYRVNLIHEYLLSNLKETSLNIDLIIIGYISKFLIFETKDININEFEL